MIKCLSEGFERPIFHDGHQRGTIEISLPYSDADAADAPAAIIGSSRHHRETDGHAITIHFKPNGALHGFPDDGDHLRPAFYRLAIYRENSVTFPKSGRLGNAPYRHCAYDRRQSRPIEAQTQLLQAVAFQI